MPHSPLVVESLALESADVEAVAEWVIDELDELMDQGQPNSHVIKELQRIQAVMAAIAHAFS
jgi:hypothetical protein